MSAGWGGETEDRRGSHGRREGGGYFYKQKTEYGRDVGQVGEEEGIKNSRTEKHAQHSTARTERRAQNAQQSTAQHSTAQQSTAQHSTHSTAQHAQPSPNSTHRTTVHISVQDSKLKNSTAFT